MSAKGFIIDAPNAAIITADGSTVLTTADSGEVTFGGDSISINGGWSQAELTEIDTTSTIDIALTDAQWKMANTQLTTGGTLTEGTLEKYFFGQAYVVDTDAIEIPYEVVAGSVQINGLTEVAATPATGEFAVTIGTGSTTIDFFAGDFADGVEINPIFKATVDNAEGLSVTTEDAPKSGVVIVEFPVYSDETDGLIEGYVQITVFKGKIMKENSFGGSYKTASVFSLSISGKDPRRSDKKFFDIAYYPVA